MKTPDKMPMIGKRGIAHDDNRVLSYPVKGETRFDRVYLTEAEALDVINLLSAELMVHRCQT